MASDILFFDRDAFLSDLLSIHVFIYTKDFREYWGESRPAAPEHLEEGEWEAAKLVCSLTRQFVEAALSPVPPPGFDPEGIGSVLNDGSDQYGLLGQLFLQAVEVELAADLSAELGRMRDRSLELLSLLRSVRAGRARAYLLRVAPCYLRGMHAEGLVMCRAVLEMAMREHVPDGAVRAPGAREQAHLDEWLFLLEQGGSLHEDVLDRVRRIDAAGNRPLRPAAPGDAPLHRIVEDLAVVLDELDRMSPTS